MCNVTKKDRYQFGKCRKHTNHTKHAFKDIYIMLLL